jgi:hypothetical protein
VRRHAVELGLAARPRLVGARKQTCSHHALVWLDDGNEVLAIIQ